MVSRDLTIIAIPSRRDQRLEKLSERIAIVFGLIFLPPLIILFLFWRKRQFARGGVAHVGADGRQYRVKRDYSSGPEGKARTVVAVAARSDISFLVRNESTADRLAKRFGLSVEHQTGCAIFDQAVYVECDDSRIGKFLSSESVRETLQDVLSRSRAIGMERVACYDGTLFARTRVATGRLPASVTDGMASRLAALADELWELPSQGGQPGQDFDRRIRQMCWLCAVVALLAAPALFFTLLTPPLIFDHGPLFVRSAGVAVLAFLLLTGCGVYWLKGSSRTHRVLATCLALGLYGFAGLGYSLAIQFNVLADFSVPNVYRFEREQFSRRVSSGKGSVTTAYSFADWRPGMAGRYRDISVTRYTYAGRQSGVSPKVIELRIRPGPLGFDWIETIAER